MIDRGSQFLDERKLGMRTENPDFDFGYKPLPEGLLKPTARKAGRLYSVIAYTFIATLVPFLLAAVATKIVALWPVEQQEDISIHKHDPIEDDPKLKAIFETVDLEVGQSVERDPPEVRHQLGYCHGVWSLKKHILWERYGIKWRTPAEMNPKIAFD
jgi:hypothetical protein